MNENTASQENDTFELTITNGAAKRLRGLMSLFGFSKAKDVVAMSLELLDAVKNSKEITVYMKDGSSKNLIISPPDTDKEERSQAAG